MLVWFVPAYRLSVRYCCIFSPVFSNRPQMRPPKLPCLTQEQSDLDWMVGSLKDQRKMSRILSPWWIWTTAARLIWATMSDEIIKKKVRHLKSVSFHSILFHCSFFFFSFLFCISDANTLYMLPAAYQLKYLAISFISNDLRPVCHSQETVIRTVSIGNSHIKNSLHSRSQVRKRS